MGSKSTRTHRREESEQSKSHEEDEGDIGPGRAATGHALRTERDPSLDIVFVCISGKSTFNTQTLCLV
jgi:hypothetical protein